MSNKETVKLNVYSSEYGEIKAFVDKEDIFFLAEDACKCLEHSNQTMATNALDADEKKSFPVEGKDGKVRNATFVTEAGLYDLIFRSRTEKAHDFKRWVTHTVLPEIRKTGLFGNEKTLAKLNKENDFLRDELIDAINRYQKAFNSQVVEKKEEKDPYLDNQYVYDCHGCLVSMREYAEANRNGDWHNA